MASDDGKAALPPYGSFRTFLNFLDKLEEGKMIPQQIDRYYWGTFLSGAAGVSLMGALRFLGLINERNEPTDLLERLVPKSQRKQQLAELLRKAYAPIFVDVDLARSMPGHLDAAFGNRYKIDGDTRRKATTFFTHAAQYAELPMSTQIQGRAKPRRGASKAASRPNGKRRTDGAARAVPDGQNGPPAQVALGPTPGPPPATHEKTIVLRRGNRLTVAYYGNLFDMDREDRAFLNKLIDDLAAHEEKLNKRGEPSADGAASLLEAANAEELAV